MFGSGNSVLNDLLEGLLCIAVSDGHYRTNKNTSLEEVTKQFGINDHNSRAIRTRQNLGQKCDSLEVLGVSAENSLYEIKLVWRELVKHSHPDQTMARGVSLEAVKLAEKRLVRVNKAYNPILA